MTHVILFSCEDAPSVRLLGTLREAGIEVAEAPEGDRAGLEGRGEAAAAGPAGEGSPVAVVYEVACGADVAALYAAVARLSAEWPSLPLVACLRGKYGERLDAPPTHELDAPLLRRLGFHAVAAEPALLPELLREAAAGGLPEGSGAEGEPAGEPEDGVDVAPASLLLPERLGTEKLRSAFEMVASLHFAADQKGAASAALAGLAALVRADRWTIYLVGETGRSEETTFEPLAARGLTASERALPEGDWRRALMGDALALTGAQSQAARAAVAYAEVVRRKEGERRTVAVPLASGDRVTGVLEAVREGSDARPFSPAEASLLSALSLPLTAALTNVVRVAEAERLSLTDDLTKLHNARFLRQYLTGELKRARRYGSTVTAMFLDLDDFKQINDRHGHLVGSHVLMEMAAVILSSVRDTDVVSRYGGDEFVVILPETNLEHATGVAERVRERISRHAFTGGRSLRLALTASFGVATFPLHAQSPQQLIAAADTAMYEAKAARKNCIRYAAEAQ
ncbi:MAG TPA: GGDEF domain-containing protein [Pyrinomonadaceae bacterium]|nr:GGDEF domain-containing protein [Pyrinomonadaceae bacterium]